jgi:vacuolar-type H+-ATPase catalytic subunit A/Vma1
LILIDEDVIESQKGVIKDVLKIILKRFSFTSGFKAVSLPIKVFKGITHFEMIANLFGNFQYIAKAVDSLDPKEKKKSKIKMQRLQRLKYLITFIISGLIHVSESRKPFNHYIGETMEASFEDGTQIFFEHVQHFRPVESFYFINENLGIKLYGSLVFTSKEYILI